jgi:ankyrin repeat protein
MYVARCVAAKAGHTQVVQLLLAAGADANLDAGDLNGSTPLFAAAMEGHTEVVQLLLAAGANLNTSNLSGSTPLSGAAFSQHHAVVQLLAAAGADVDAPDFNDWTPLYWAAARGHRGTVQLLLRLGANPQVRNAFDKTALHAAAKSSHVGIVQLLLEAWGQPQITADDLATAAQGAAYPTSICNLARPPFAWLAKELRRLYPAELHQVFEGQQAVPPARALAVVLNAWASDVSSLDEQRAAVRVREEAVARETAAMQQVVVAIAGLARSAQHHA